MLRFRAGLAMKPTRTAQASDHAVVHPFGRTIFGPELAEVTFVTGVEEFRGSTNLLKAS